MLPYHPLDPEYEDYTYDEELEHVTQPFVPSQHIVSQLFTKNEHFWIFFLYRKDQKLLMLD